MKKRRTEINIEIDEVTFLKNRRRPARTWCPACGKEVMMVTPEQAAAIVPASVRTINRWVESELVHFRETPDGLLLVCADSLATHSSASDPQDGSS